MIKLLTDYLHFQKGEVINFGQEKNSQLVKENKAVWVKIQDLQYATK
jgi:hypothetical protein